MPSPTLVRCAGDDGAGCGQEVAVVHRGSLLALACGTILRVDRDRQASILCQACGAITRAAPGPRPAGALETSSTSDGMVLG